MFKEREPIMRLLKTLKYEAWLLDEDVLLLGKVKRKGLRHIFVPNDHRCGFSYQYVSKKDIGQLLFYNDFHIEFAGYGHMKRIR